ncbi:MAG: ABC transporter permease [Candidatus Freyarchaeota archaeon]
MGSIILGVAFMNFITTTIAILHGLGDMGASIEKSQQWLVYISLLVCMVSITNSMLIAVYERYKEIGIMKCLGALDRHIFMLFLVESVVLGLVGGAIGFAAGTTMAFIAQSLQLGLEVLSKVPGYHILSSFGASLLLSISLSVIATLYPAYKAAKSNPVEALQFEI